MKEIQQKQRFDLLVALAALGIVLMIGFESIFIFELYRINPDRLPAGIRSVVGHWLVSDAPVQEPVVAPAEPIEEEISQQHSEPVSSESVAPAVEVEQEPAPAPEQPVSDEDAVPVG